MSTIQIIMVLFLGYVIWRTVHYFKKGKPQFGIATAFIACILIFEIVRALI